MKTYLVGGAVRDQLLGIPVKEKDWVVVGATPEDMLRRGFKQVGKEFPVFLHPKTAEEYALARKERKVAPGYTGFTFDTSPQVTLEEDLLRRDLTINAMAQTPEGELIDPYHGRDDLVHKMLRHVSPAFTEDPVRILRIARFAARYADRGFGVAKETMELMKDMVASGEVNALVAERVWKEFERALSEKSPDIFFKVLAECGALAILFPMIHIDGPEIVALQKAVKLSADAVIRFSVLMHIFSKEEISWLCKRYRIPVEYRELALLVSRYYQHVLRFSELSTQEILHLFLMVDAFRRENRFKKFLLVCQAIAELKQSQFSLEDIREAYQAAKQVDVKDLLGQGLAGPQIAEKLKEKRLKRIEAWKK